MDQATRELLTAYLDGELPADEAAAIDRRLASDEALRKQVQEFDQVWNALDGLPRPEASEGFAKTTIEMAAVQAGKEVVAKTAMLPRVKRRRGWGVAAASLAALVLGFVIVRLAVMQPERELIANLPVIYRLDGLQEVDSPAFLRRLPQAAPAILHQADADRVTQDLAAWSRIADGDPADRAEWVASLDEDAKATLLDAARRYARDTTAARREAARATFATIAAADDRDQLMRTALQYEAWLASQPASDQSRLRQMPVDQRLEELAKINRRLAAKAARSLPPEDLAALRLATVSLKGSAELTSVRDALLNAFERGSQFRRRFDPERAAQAAAAVPPLIERVFETPAIAVQTVARLTDSRGFPFFELLRKTSPPEAGDAIQAAADHAWVGIEAELIAALSKPSQERLRGLDPARRRRWLADLVLRAVRDASVDIDLESFFTSDALTDEERHRLLALPTGEMTDQLEQMYAQRVVGGMEEEMREIIGLMRELPGGGMRPGEGGPPRFRERFFRTDRDGRRDGPGRRGLRRPLSDGPRGEGGGERPVPGFGTL